MTRTQRIWHHALLLVRRRLDEFWFQGLAGGVWMLGLGFLGYFEIQPLALRIVCWPVLGITNTTFFIWEAARESRRCSVGEYLLISLFAAPGVALLAGLLLGGVLYGVVEGMRWILGTL